MIVTYKSKKVMIEDSARELNRAKRLVLNGMYLGAEGKALIAWAEQDLSFTQGLTTFKDKQAAENKFRNFAFQRSEW